MSYAIIRNDKLTRVDAQGSYIHNDRRSKGHSNKDIDPSRTHLNFYCKENQLTYIKEFDRMKKEYDLSRRDERETLVKLPKGERIRNDRQNP